MAITRIGNPAIADQRGVNFRNIIINGGMDIAQRGTSATGLTNGSSGYHTCDRWNFQETGGPSFVFTQTQDTDVPTGQGFAYSLKMDCTTAQASLASNDLLRIQQFFEGQNLQYLKYGTSSAESLTASFWVKSNVTGDYNTHLLNQGTTLKIISSTFTINSADTWEKKIITFAGDTAQGFLNDSLRRLEFTITLLAGTDYTSTDATSWGSYSSGKLAYGQTANVASSTSNYINITGVQLEAGQVASDFEFLPKDVNLQSCKRYYEKSYPLINTPGADTDDGMVCIRIAGSFSNKPFPARFSVEKRNNSPTITLYSKIGAVNNISNMGSGTSHTSNDGITAVAQVGSTGFAYVTGVTGTNTEGHCLHYTADCEL